MVPSGTKVQGAADTKIEAPLDVHRLRLLEGFAAAVSEHGYATTTIAHIVKYARVSKRTFYEHFADKEECFLALYEEVAELLRRGVEEALLAPARSWEAQLDAGLDSYLTIRAAGPRALALRLRGRARFAEMLRAFVARSRAEHPYLRPLSSAMATAVVGGIDELLLENVEPGAKSSLSETRATAAELIRSVVRAGPR